MPRQQHVRWLVRLVVLLPVLSLTGCSGSSASVPARSPVTTAAAERPAPELPADPEAPRRVDCAAPSCRWLLEEVVDAAAPALVGDVEVRGRNRIGIEVQSGGAVRGRADFFWKEWQTGPDCASTGIFHQEVSVSGRLRGESLRLLLHRESRTFHAMKRCPGSKGLQLLELPNGDVPLVIGAHPGSAADAALASPLHGSHRYLLLDTAANMA